jgi:peptidoglycan/xylan/chitin deacetylase (PgdA/CDA1 family)
VTHWRALALALALAACSRGTPEVPILNYHSIGKVADEFTVPVQTFAVELDWLAANGFRTVSLHDLLESRRNHRPLPPRSVILTFDDGKEDALRVVLPELERRGMRATFFVITGEVGQPGYLTWEGVRKLAAAGMEIGSHTVTHARLPDLPAERVDAELRDSRAELESHLHRPIEALADPYNSLGSRTVRAALSAGYSIAVAGPAHGTADDMRLLRLPVDGRAGASGMEKAVAPASGR